MLLYSYYRSSAAYRVRIALHYKKIPFEMKTIHLLRDGGEQLQANYKALNPQGLVPLLVVGSHKISQSMAIIEYLEEQYPAPSLLPSDATMRAFVRSLALTIGCDVHPLNNLRVLRYLQNKLGVDEDDKQIWIHHWMKEGFTAIEQQLVNYAKAGPYCLGEQWSLADVFLIPQVYNAIRFSVNLTPYPTIQKIYETALELPFVKLASPEQQPDFE